MKFPNHKCALYLMHNDHKSYYQDAAEWCKENPDFGLWRNEESKARAIATNEIWYMRWYKHTPIGFTSIAAPTLEELLAFAEEFKE